MNKSNPSAAMDRTSNHRFAGIAGLIIVLAAGLMLSACNTTNGAGQDLTAAGRGVSKTAVDVKNKL